MTHEEFESRLDALFGGSYYKPKVRELILELIGPNEERDYVVKNRSAVRNRLRAELRSTVKGEL
jgi:hypothetical protein